MPEFTVAFSRRSVIKEWGEVTLFAEHAGEAELRAAESEINWHAMEVGAAGPVDIEDCYPTP